MDAYSPTPTGPAIPAEVVTQGFRPVQARLSTRRRAIELLRFTNEVAR